MLVDILLLLVHVVITLILGILNALTSVLISAATLVGIYDNIRAAWVWVFSYMNALNGIFPVDTAVDVLTFLLIVVLIRYAIEILQWFLQVIPWIGTKEQAKLPNAK